MSILPREEMSFRNSKRENRERNRHNKRNGNTSSYSDDIYIIMNKDSFYKASQADFQEVDLSFEREPDYVSETLGRVKFDSSDNDEHWTFLDKNGNVLGEDDIMDADTIVITDYGDLYEDEGNLYEDEREITYKVGEIFEGEHGDIGFKPRVKSSEYRYTGEGVYRESDHWGDIKNCRRTLNGNEEDGYETKTGFCKWEDFKPYDKRREIEIATDPTTSAERLESLSESADDVVRSNVIEHGSVSTETLKKMLEKDESREIKGQVLRKLQERNVEPEFLNEQIANFNLLRNSKNNAEKELLAKSSFATVETLGILGNKGEVGDVHRAVAGNKKTSADTLDALSRISDYDWRLDEIIAKHPNVSPETLARIGKKNLSHSALEARYNVAGHPNTPVDVLEKLSTDWFANVRIAVISNKHTPKSVLQKMGENDKSKDIRKLAEEELSRREK